MFQKSTQRTTGTAPEISQDGAFFLDPGPPIPTLLPLDDSTLAPLGELSSPFRVDFDIGLTFRVGVRTGKDINSGAMFISMNHLSLVLGLIRGATELCEKLPPFNMNDQYCWVVLLNLARHGNSIDRWATALNECSVHLISR